MKKANPIKKYFSSKQRGFTILETLVAVFILVLSLTGPMAFAQSGLRAAFLARDQITAFFLAQDAVETIKNIRDQNKLDGQEWLENLEDCDPSDELYTCNIDTTGASVDVQTCSSSGGLCDPMEYDPDTGEFSISGGSEDSPFTRTIYLYETKPDQEAMIVVMVTWESNAIAGTRKVVVQENITNWYPNE